jgi:hypothetical protein
MPTHPPVKVVVSGHVVTETSTRSRSVQVDVTEEGRSTLTVSVWASTLDDEPWPEPKVGVGPAVYVGYMTAEQMTAVAACAVDLLAEYRKRWQ